MKKDKSATNMQKLLNLVRRKKRYITQQEERRSAKRREWYVNLVATIRYHLFIKPRFDRAIEENSFEMKYYKWWLNPKKFSHRLINKIINKVLGYPSYSSPIDRVEYDWIRMFIGFDKIAMDHYSVPPIGGVRKTIEDPMNKYNTKTFDQLTGREKEEFFQEVCILKVTPENVKDV